MADHAFGASALFSLGVEEELFVVDPATLLPVPAPPALYDGVRRKRELFTCLVELTTPVCESAADAADALSTLRLDACRRAADAGLALAAAGTHPLALLGAQELTDDPELRAVAARAAPAIRAQLCLGLHVHVGVASPAACTTALEAVLPWLPLLLALSANSPYLEGRETGYASTRAELLTRLPRTGAPPPLPSYRRWQRFVRRLVELGLVDDYRRIWWDVRPHPRFGTLEVRMPDQPTRLEVTLALVAAVQALVASAEPRPPADRALYAESRFEAACFGARARLVHPQGTHRVSVPELTAELLEHVAPAAARLGADRYLGPLEALAERTQADEQLALGPREAARRLQLTPWPS